MARVVAALVAVALAAVTAGSSETERVGGRAGTRQYGMFMGLQVRGGRATRRPHPRARTD